MTSAPLGDWRNATIPVRVAATGSNASNRAKRARGIRCRMSWSRPYGTTFDSTAVASASSSTHGTEVTSSAGPRPTGAMTSAPTTMPTPRPSIDRAPAATRAPSTM